MTGDVIKQFLVGLGFGVDDSSLKKFNSAIKDATVRITALYASTNLLAGAIVKSISSISEGFEQMGYEYHLIAPAINKALVLRREMLKAYSAAGINIQKVIASSIKLNFSLAKTRFALDAIYKSVGSKFFALLTKQSDIFRNNLYKYMPKIQAALEKFVNFIFKAFAAVTTLGLRLWSILTRVYDFFVQLDKATDGWSTIILGVVAAWKLLNLSFLATPLGLLLSLGLAVLTLWDDFKTFKEGGQSLINWGSDFTKTVVGLVSAVSALGVAFGAWKVVQSIIGVLETFNKVLSISDALLLVMEAPFWAIAAAIGAVVAALTLADAKWGIFGGHVSGFFSSIGGKVLDFLGGGGGGSVASGVGSPLQNPIGSNVQNSSVNQNVRQQTTINVNGSADANATGRAVSNEQGRVTQDMVRNMKGATR